MDVGYSTFFRMINLGVVVLDPNDKELADIMDIAKDFKVSEMTAEQYRAIIYFFQATLELAEDEDNESDIRYKSIGTCTAICFLMGKEYIPADLELRYEKTNHMLQRQLRYN